MKAARIYAEEDVRVEDVEVKEVGAKDVKVEVAWTGICGSDLHAYSHFVVFRQKSIQYQKDKLR